MSVDTAAVNGRIVVLTALTSSGWFPYLIGRGYDLLTPGRPGALEMGWGLNLAYWILGSAVLTLAVIVLAVVGGILSVILSVDRVNEDV
ncbi:hypothetical protein PM015_17965 [Halorubrum ezzemoulense]|uniref:hypothetical protein n=1 Tax=Halorubrum ezzemoulense TaxID=337243 RepID=UPI00232C1510|nr:hypothetical protein [Halorubrum ezzemoulense]MDB2246572.1 hypothetical protein [Halorubrum ezzemoulense]